MSRVPHSPAAVVRLLGRVLALVLALAGVARADGPARLSWTNNLLHVVDPRIPGGSVDVFYLEAFCLPGGHERPWSQTRVPHHTELLSTNRTGTRLEFRTLVGTNVEVLHRVRSVVDGVEMTFRLRNLGASRWDVEWFQPACVRVDRFTGRDQAGYTGRSFVFTGAGRTWLDQVRRTTNAPYAGGQVYLPPWVPPADANPRPIALDRVTNGIIGCVSGDSAWLLALASSRTFELFEGVYVCLHSDPWIGGLAPGEVRNLRQMLYIVPNNPERLLQLYRRDFPPRDDGRW